MISLLLDTNQKEELKDLKQGQFECQSYPSLTIINGRRIFKYGTY